MNAVWSWILLGPAATISLCVMTMFIYATYRTVTGKNRRDK